MSSQLKGESRFALRYLPRRPTALTYFQMFSGVRQVLTAQTAQEGIQP